MVARALVHLLGETPLFLFEVTGLGEQLKVLRFSGSEGMSSLFEFQVELACDYGSQLNVPISYIHNAETSRRCPRT